MEMEANVAEPAETTVGVVWTVPCTPSPNRPYPDEPQHHSAPAAVRPHVAFTDTASCVNTWPVDTGTGVDRSTMVPSPSWPYPLEPQQNAWPPLVSPQA